MEAVEQIIDGKVNMEALHDLWRMAAKRRKEPREVRVARAQKRLDELHALFKTMTPKDTIGKEGLFTEEHILEKCLRGDYD
jgi:hypothetical protein